MIKFQFKKCLDGLGAIVQYSIDPTIRDATFDPLLQLSNSECNVSFLRTIKKSSVPSVIYLMILIPIINSCLTIFLFEFVKFFFLTYYSFHIYQLSFFFPLLFANNLFDYLLSLSRIIKQHSFFQEAFLDHQLGLSVSCLSSLSPLHKALFQSFPKAYQDKNVSTSKAGPGYYHLLCV